MHILTDIVLSGETTGHARIFPARLRPVTFSQTFQRNKKCSLIIEFNKQRFLLFDTNNFPGAP